MAEGCSPNPGVPRTFVVDCRLNAPYETAKLKYLIRYFRRLKAYLCFFLACEQDMETLFVNEFSNTSLRVLEAGDEKAISIRNTWSSCELDRNHSWYFGCSDSRLSFPFKFYLETMMNLFTLAKGDFYLNLKVRNYRCIHAYGKKFNCPGESLNLRITSQ